MRIFRFVSAPTVPLTRAPPSGVLMGEGRGGGGLSGIRPYALLCLLCLILYAPGLAAIPPLDRDEARFAQATRQMLETGDFVRIRFQDEARNKKPIGIYWLQAAAVAAFSSPESAAIWPYRLPSAFAATAAVLLTFGFGARLFDSRPAGFIAAVADGKRVGRGGRGAPRQDRCGASRRRCCGAGRARARLHCNPHRPPGRLAASASLLAGRSRRDSAEGAARPDVGAVDGGLPVDRRSRHPLGQKIAAACRRVDHGGDGGSVADRGAKRHRGSFHLGLARTRSFAKAGRRPGIARRAARLLPGAW